MNFSETPTYKIVAAMKATGNREGVIARWKRMMESWAANVQHPDADAVKAWLPLWHVREIYDAAELAPMFPALAVLLGFAKRVEAQKGADRLANELRAARLPHREINGRTYFAVERCHIWREASMSAWRIELAP